MIFKGGFIGFISLAAFLTVQLVSTIALEAQTHKIRIAHSSRSNTTAPFYVAVTKGLFKEEGLEAELIQVNPRLGAMAVINGDVSFTTSFVSTFRGILQGLPLKLVMVGQKKGVYFLIARPDIKDVQDLKGKTLGVSTMRGTDHLVTEELLRAKGLDPSLLRAVALGDTAVRAQSVAAGVVQAVTVSPPHDLTLQKMGFQVLAGPPEVGLPASGLFTSDRLIKENPQVVRHTLRPDESQPLYRRQSRSDHCRVAAMDTADAGNCRAILRFRAQGNDQRRSDERCRSRQSHGPFRR
jgi:ABC-type nitrate/sulfonate/bicarbonate transport system substrate-binding protein